MPSDILHRSADCIAGIGRHQEVDMIGHQRVGMQLATIALEAFAQPIQIGRIVARFKEDRLAVITALNDMGRDPRHLESGFPWHPLTIYFPNEVSEYHEKGSDPFFP